MWQRTRRNATPVIAYEGPGAIPSRRFSEEIAPDRKPRDRGRRNTEQFGRRGTALASAGGTQRRWASSVSAGRRARSAPARLHGDHRTNKPRGSDSLGVPGARPRAPTVVVGASSVRPFANDSDGMPNDRHHLAVPDGRVRHCEKRRALQRVGERLLRLRRAHTRLAYRLRRAGASGLGPPRRGPPCDPCASSRGSTARARPPPSFRAR
jgi:hypothetical protein